LKTEIIGEQGLEIAPATLGWLFNKQCFAELGGATPCSKVVVILVGTVCKK